jgi:hypothetical protein
MNAEERKQAEEILAAILQEIKPIGKSQLSDVRITSDLGKKIIIDVAERLASLRVAEAMAKMPSEEEMDAEVDKRFPDVGNPHILGKQFGFGECYYWFRNHMIGGE